MRWNKPKNNLYKWHRWFAWRPVVIEQDHGDNLVVWLETVERRLLWEDGVFIQIRTWDYQVPG
jgi:hypothetical protein